jgi:hypothetical protein
MWDGLEDLPVTGRGPPADRLSQSLETRPAAVRTRWRLRRLPREARGGGRLPGPEPGLGTRLLADAAGSTPWPALPPPGWLG